MSEWISVKDKLPAKTQPCLAWDEYYLMCTAVISMDGKWLLDASYIDGGKRIELQSVTHWMQLPTPPKN